MWCLPIANRGAQHVRPDAVEHEEQRRFWRPIVLGGSQDRFILPLSTRLDDLGFRSFELGMDSRTDQFQLHNSEIRLLLAGCGRGGGGGGLLLTCRGRGGTPAVRSLGTLSCCGRGRPVSSWLRRSGWLGRSRGRSATTGVADDGLVTAERVPAILPDAIQGSRATRVHRAARERGARASATVAQG